MINLQRALEIVNKINYTQLPFIAQWQDIYYRTSIHTTGTCPCFFPIRNRGEGDTYPVLSTSVFFPNGWLHARYDFIFDTHLLNRHPREPEITRQFRKSVYRPYQMAPLLECIQSTSACIFGDSKYTLTVDDKADNDYINGHNFEGKTLVEYFEWMFKAICEDPNSLFVVIPKEAGYNTPANQKVEPVIKHIPSRDIIYIDGEEIIYYDWDKRYAWYVNELGYFRFENIEGTYYPMDANVGYYAHLLTYKPAHFAGGIWNTNRFYDSYLKPAQAFCDDFVAAHSDVQMINKEACHPIIIAASMDCPACNGHKQDNYCLACNLQVDSCTCSEDIRRWQLVDCRKCNGSGQMSHNPADWYIVPKEDMAQDIVKVVQFDTAVNTYMADYADKIQVGIRKSLHQFYVEEAQSGVAKEIDRSSMYLYRSTVSNGIWGLIEKCLIDILSIRNTSQSDGKVKPTPPKYVLVKPTDFDLKTEDDLLAEYKESTAAYTPEWVRQRQIEQYVDKVFGGDATMKKTACIINDLDPYSVTNITDKTAMLAASGITPKDYLFSNSLPGMIKQVIRTKGNEWFLNAEFVDIQTEINTIFGKMIPLPVPAVTTNTDKTVVV